jgi:uncharacterized protein YecT (DUF1311 family)
MVGLRLVFIAFCVIACIAPVRAATSPVYDACLANAKTQTAITTCAAEELTRAEHGLNLVYANLIHTLAGHPDSIARIRAAQRAWIAYRDAYLEAMYPAKAKQAEYGSVYPMEADLDLADVTRQQTIALTHMLKAAIGCHNSNGGCVHPSLK